ncbi:MAG: malate dehydrogenase [Candidatus Dadabacteria bacterium]|nr:malate dehydrogenase [Candidatus Dadabacteria bacterium]MCZ6468161.1 malate dehydrogenase [Candidatus Dadabacteria bacterium]MCZ6555424.1 malate dehydrogenase [Candidatus Dadabacteria bacterium]MCZ6639905.1 malate dehydrogenase [Candidatus Dadabacteria bacterium]MCZ6791185.1 malate dehydrogenase [Candidatus Dadabacteria bacterium]
MASRPKISVIGAGNVGATTALMLAGLEHGDIVLVDIIEDMPQGKALDLMEMSPVLDYDSVITGTNNYDDTEGSDVVVITSGIPRKPGMSRDDLISTNTSIVKQVTEQVAAKSPNAILILVTNPLDAMVYVAHKVSGFPKHRVMGMAGALDSARFVSFIAMELGVSVENINAFVLGGHGDDMVPLERFTTVAGVPITELMPPDRVEALIQRTRGGGGEIVKLLKTGSAFYAPAASAVEMVEAIVKDKKKIIPSCVLAEGEYGIENTFVGLPVKLGKTGIEEILEIKLTDEESKALHVSASHVKELCEHIEGMGIL